MYPVWLRYCF